MNRSIDKLLLQLEGIYDEAYIDELSEAIYDSTAENYFASRGSDNMKVLFYKIVPDRTFSSNENFIRFKDMKIGDVLNFTKADDGIKPDDADLFYIFLV